METHAVATSIVDECHFSVTFSNFIYHKLSTNVKILFIFYIQTKMCFEHDLFAKMTLD